MKVQKADVVLAAVLDHDKALGLAREFPLFADDIAMALINASVSNNDFFVELAELVSGTVAEKIAIEHKVIAPEIAVNNPDLALKIIEALLEQDKEMPVKVAELIAAKNKTKAKKGLDQKHIQVLRAIFAKYPDKTNEIFAVIKNKCPSLMDSLVFDRVA